MKVCRFLVFIIIVVLLTSCFFNRGNRNNVPEIPLEKEQSVSNAPATIEEMKQFIYENERRIIERKLEIEFISRGNFGIPDGDNWVIRLNDHSIIIYAINGNKIEKRFYFASDNLDFFSSFDIMQDIHGTRIGNSTSAFGDYNGDGMDELFRYGEFVVIRGYNAEEDDFTIDCRIPSRIIDWEHGPAPVEFMTYQGMYGFKVYYYAPEQAGGLGWTPNPSPKNRRWFFYTWDAEQRKYVEVGEVEE